MPSTSYQIVDEPTPSGIAQFATNPLWPFLAMMLGGGWIGLPWFAINAFAIGSARRTRELATLAGGTAVSALLVTAILSEAGPHGVPFRAVPYLLLGVVALKLWVSYSVLLSQQPSFELFQYFGGVAKNGAIIALGSAYLGRSWILELLPEHNLVSAVALWVLS